MHYEFFVMLSTQQGGIVPMVDDDDEIVLFASEADARTCAHANILGHACGFEIFQRGTGTE